MCFKFSAMKQYFSQKMYFSYEFEFVAKKQISCSVYVRSLVTIQCHEPIDVCKMVAHCHVTFCVYFSS